MKGKGVVEDQDDSLGSCLDDIKVDLAINSRIVAAEQVAAVLSPAHIATTPKSQNSINNDGP